MLESDETLRRVFSTERPNGYTLYQTFDVGLDLAVIWRHASAGRLHRSEVGGNGVASVLCRYVTGEQGVQG